MNENQITLSEWVKGEQETLDSFIKFWDTNNTVNPEQFPSSMPVGEWDEQYRLFTN